MCFFLSIPFNFVFTEWKQSENFSFLLLFLSFFVPKMKMNNNSLSFFFSFSIAVYVFIFRSYKYISMLLFFFSLVNIQWKILFLFVPASEFVFKFVPSNNIHLLIDHRQSGNWMVKAFCQRIFTIHGRLFSYSFCQKWNFSRKISKLYYGNGTLPILCNVVDDNVSSNIVGNIFYLTELFPLARKVCRSWK